MATGKQTPRQKMINMMYLVLTAMLALNVSVEVLEAFVNIDKGLNQSIAIIQEKNEDALRNFTLAMAENKDKVEKWKIKADSVHEKTKELFDYIQQIKVKIIRKGDGENSEALIDSTSINVGAINAKDNTDAASHVMLGQLKSGEAYTLRKKLNEYKQFLLGCLDENSSSASSIAKTLQTDDPPATGGTFHTWETATFDNVPLVSAVAILSKQQLDIVNCESEALAHLQGLIGKEDFKFSNIETAVIPSSNYIIKGTEYNAEIFLAAYDPSQRPTLVVNGRTYTSDEQGKIKFTTIATDIGHKNIPGIVKFIGPDGMTEKPVSMIFDVAEPNVVISPTKMNVVYRGIDNPISVSLSGVSLDRLKVDPTNATITQKGNEFLLRPGSGRTCEITVSLDGKKMGNVSFRIKDVPLPVAAIFGLPGKTASKGELQAAEGIVAEMRDFDFDFRYKVTTFTVAVVTSDGYTREETARSEKFTDKQKQLFAGLKQGQRVIISDIKALGDDGRTVELNDFAVKIK